jgi:hypothetical protein
MTTLGIALLKGQRFEDAVTTLQDAAVIFRETGDRRREGAVLNNLGGALLKAKRLKEAITTLQDAVQILHHVGDQDIEGVALTNLEAARKAQLPGRRDHAPGPPQLVFGFGNTSQRAIRTGIALISDLISDRH